MSTYRPKFFDIRVKPPKNEPAPEERICEWGGCQRSGLFRAPKAPDRPQDYHWFCRDHVAQYNKNWNFFSKMSDEEVQAFQKNAATGHRPSWVMGARGASQDKKRRYRAAMERGFSETSWEDTHDILGQKKEKKPQKHLSRLQEKALEDLGLGPEADSQAIRTRYTKLLKLYHPDAKGGDRSDEAALQRVITAYKTLKKAKLA